MDPNELLAQLRENARKIQDGLVNHDPVHNILREAATMAETFQELDAYMSAGSVFAPGEWTS